MKKNKKIPAKVNSQTTTSNLKSSSLLDLLPVLFLSTTLFLVPLFPDEKLNRLKLIAFGAGLILTAVLWALSKIFGQGWSFYRTPLDPCLAIYLLAAILYYKSSLNPAVASSELQRMIFSVGAFFVTVQVCSGEQAVRFRKMVLRGWIAGLFLISIYGILQKNGGIGRIMVPQMERVFGTFGNPIFFAAFLITSIPVNLAWLVQSRNFWLRVLLFMSFSLALAALFFTGTRAAFISLPIALALFYLLLELRWRWRWTKSLWRSKFAILTILALTLCGHFFLNHFDDNYHRMTQNMANAIRASRATATSQTHTLIWKDVLKMWRAHPWFGTGYGTFHIEFPQYASEELKKVFPQQERIVNDAHNEYLQILAETGVIGFLIFISMLLIFYLKAIQSLYSPFYDRQNDPDRQMILFAGLLAGITALLFQNFFSVDMRFIVSSTYLFFAMGLLVSFFSKPMQCCWGTDWQAFVFKLFWSGFFIFSSGLLGFRQNPGRVFFAGIYQLGKNQQGIWEWTKTPAEGPGLLPALLRPYMAQKVLAQTPDFFDERLLNSAQTINDLEILTRQHPEQWKYWEKLGFALAKEIQKKAPDGRKVNDRNVAEKAISAYMKAYGLNPSAEGPPNNIGNIYYTLNSRREAMDWWKKAIGANPDKIDARLNLGLAYYYEGKIKEAANQFEEVLKRDPRNEKAIVMLKRMVE